MIALLALIVQLDRPALTADDINLAQPASREASTATAAIRGRVTREDGRPLPRASVRLMRDDGNMTPLEVASTDDSGSYELTKVRPGGYRLAAAKTGYAVMEFNQRRPFEHGDSIFLAARETRDHVDVVLRRHGAIEGRIVDENGDPLEGVSIAVSHLRFKAGRRQLVPVPRVMPRRTNELGRYRVYGLPPGDYVISAEVGKVGTDDVPGYATTYFPGTAVPGEARAIRIGFGDEVSGVDFALAASATARITGTTVTSNGVPFQGGIQMRPSLRSGAILGDETGARTLPDGSFEFPNVPPGEYVLYAFHGVEMTWQFVTVNGADVAGVAMQTLPGSTISGRIAFEGPEIPSARDISLTPVPADQDLAPFIGGPGHADIQDNWTFNVANVSGPRRLSVLRPPDGWSLKSILHNGTDVTDAVLSLGTPAQSLDKVEVVLTRQQSHISGRVGDGRDNIGGCAVLAFAADADKRWTDSRFFAVTRTTRDGTFSIDGLPPGDYLVAATDRARDEDEWRDPDLLNVLERAATRVTLIEGQSVTLQLRRP